MGQPHSPFCASGVPLSPLDSSPPPHKSPTGGTHPTQFPTPVNSLPHFFSLFFQSPPAPSSLGRRSAVPHSRTVMGTAYRWAGLRNNGPSMGQFDAERFAVVGLKGIGPIGPRFRQKPHDYCLFSRKTQDFKRCGTGADSVRAQRVRGTAQALQTAWDGPVWRVCIWRVSFTLISCMEDRGGRGHGRLLTSWLSMLSNLTIPPHCRG